MKKLRIVSIIVFILSVLIFGVYTYKERIAKDQTGPVFAMDSDSIQVSVKDGNEALLSGIVVTDAHDGDITDSVLVESVGPFNEEGSRVVRYLAIDSDDQVAHASRKLSYTDYTDPVFHMEQPLVFPTDSSDLLKGVTAQDCIDGDISDKIELIPEEDADISHGGEFKARLKVTNSVGGSSQLPVTVEIYDDSMYYRLPKLILKDYIVYLNKGESFKAADHLQSVVIGGIEYVFVEKNGTYANTGDDKDIAEQTIEYSRVKVAGSVDTNTPGCYEVSYSFDDVVSGTGTGSVRMYVVVAEGGTK